MLFKELCGRFGTLVLDESSNVKNHWSKSFGLCRRLSRMIPHRYCLTGTPIDKDPQDFWSQFWLIDHGHSLGETLGLFRSAFFVEKPNYWGGFEYEFKQTMKRELSRR